MGMLDGRVAVITGAGRGLGREHALLFAAEGAKVLVNDLGGAGDGSGSDTSAAEQVATEIRAAGGEAVANSDSVTSFEAAGKIISSAVAAFGELHILVNNAGILRDRMLVSMTEDDFDTVIAVHLKGTFNLSHHAAEYWRDRTHAGEVVDRAIINTASTSGLTGQVGQTNYSAAKAGVAAMTLVNAAELTRYGVRSNCIVPVARTRLTEQTPGLAGNMNNALFDPVNVSPLVACLAAPDCSFNGQLFSVYGGSVGIYGGWSIADEITTGQRWSTAELRAALDDLPRSIEVTTQTDSMLGRLGSTSHAVSGTSHEETLRRES